MKESKSYLIDLLKDKDIIIAGISGGPDSMALLYLLKEIRKNKDISIVCSHVNHNLRKESEKEKQFLENWCNENDILFESMIIEQYSDDNFHNEARNIRYQFFESLVNKYRANYLMTAHHGDDLMETILMRLVRGSTLKGYGGFQKIVSKKNYQIVRPFINATKQEIEDYNEKNCIPYVIDQSNKKDKYTRNRYRKVILPFLKQEDANVNKKFLKFSVMLDEYDQFINQYVEKVFHQIYRDQNLIISKFLELESIIQDKVLYNFLESIYNDDLILIHDRHIELIKKLIKSSKKNTYIYLPNNVKLIKTYDLIRVYFEGTNEDNYNIELIDFVHLSNGKNLEVVDIVEVNGNDICRLSNCDVELPLYIRTRKHGDKIALKGTNGHRKIKDIFIDEKIPIDERDLWPIVVDSRDTIVWIPGIKKSKFNKQKNEKCDIIIKYY